MKYVVELHWGYQLDILQVIIQIPKALLFKQKFREQFYCIHEIMFVHRYDKDVAYTSPGSGLGSHVFSHLGFLNWRQQIGCTKRAV